MRLCAIVGKLMTVNQSKSFVASLITMSNYSLVDMSQVILF